MSLPSFLCIGAQKAATSWLYSILRQHPDVWLPPFKEMHFFDDLYVPENRAWTRNQLKNGARYALDRHFSKSTDIDIEYVKYLCDLALVDVFTEAWYKRIFDRPNCKNKTLGDITPEYCTIPIEGIDYVKKLLGNIRLIYLIRDPFERALSQIRMHLQRQYGDRISGLEEKQLQEELPKIPVCNRGDYKTYIPNWVSVFGNENILFLPFKMVRDDPHRVMRMVERHLALPNYSGYSSLNVPVHVTKKVKIPDSVIEPIANELHSQREYLQAYFNSEFISMI